MNSRAGKAGGKAGQKQMFVLSLMAVIFLSIFAVGSFAYMAMQSNALSAVFDMNKSETLLATGQSLNKVFKSKGNGAVTKVVFGDRAEYADVVKNYEKSAENVDYQGKGYIKAYFVPNSGGNTYTVYILPFKEKVKMYANKTMYTTFKDCTKLSQVAFENFDTSRVTNMSYVFTGCSSLRNVDLSGFNTGKVQNIRNIFERSGIEKVDMSGFNTKNLTNMRSMFYQAYNLKTVDLSGFDTSKVATMRTLFYQDSKLTTVFVNEKLWSTAGLSTEQAEQANKFLFDDCTSIKGGNGTVYNASRTSALYARVDKTGKPGYFTAKTSNEAGTPDETAGGALIDGALDESEDSYGDLHKDEGGAFGAAPEITEAEGGEAASSESGELIDAAGENSQTCEDEETAGNGTSGKNIPDGTAAVNRKDKAVADVSRGRDERSKEAVR